MSEAQGHSLGVAAIFALMALSLLLYTMARPENRPETLRLGISRCALCAVAYAANAFLAGLEIGSLRLQELAVAPVNFAIMTTVATICTVQARSLGTLDISPRARQLLRHTPHAFVVCFALNLAMSMVWPVPVIERFGAAPPHYLLNRDFVTAAEAFFLGVAAFVPWQAAGPREPVGRIRLQHAAFFGAHVLLVSIALNTYSAVCFRIFVGDDPLRRSLIESTLARESWLGAGAATLYVIALALYYTNDKRMRTIALFSKWQRARRELDQRLWSLENEEFAERFPTYGLISAAAWELVERASSERSEDDFRPADVRTTLDTFKLFAIAADAEGCIRQPEDAALASVQRYQESMLRGAATAGMSWPITSAPTPHLAYSVAADPLPQAVRMLRQFLKDRREPRLLGEPQWFQLAVLCAAHAGILTREKDRAVRRPGAVMDRVARAYQNAPLREDFSGRCRPFNPCPATPSKEVTTTPDTKFSI